MRVEALKKPFNASFEHLASDKSISHRCAIFSLLSSEPSVIENYLEAEDTLNTLKIIQALGANVRWDKNKITITPPKEIKSTKAKVLDCGNSGTAIRLLMGFLASKQGEFILDGDEYLRKRPMRRVVEPLEKIGAVFEGKDKANFAPIKVKGKKLEFFSYDSPIASAQVKTAMILAGLNGKGCKISEPSLSRDHSEKMLSAMGASLSVDESKDGKIKIEVSSLKSPLKPINMVVPNDPSSCFFYALAAAIIPNSSVEIKNMLLNKTRIEAFKVLSRMGAKIEYKPKSGGYDDTGDVKISYNGRLKAVDVSENIAWLIDEAPALAIAFACADGTSTLKNAKELRVKECDRIAVTVSALRACGIEASELEDGFTITGGVAKSASIDSHGDHRIAMSFAVLGLLCGMEISKSEFIATSFPNFTKCLESLGAVVNE